MSNSEIMASPPTNVNTHKKVTLSVAKEIQKVRERGSSDSEIVEHILEADGQTKPATPKSSFKENSVNLRDKDDIP